eukprot:CAMPEP_0206578020 /NCGR_PEP_ID=MMETSP0325_2-20121206/31712_1 /ASSEMBLY_ACC=CAM_ASM_000347 /TAXON_ID=2866 /ORGANISM="Crypthecodinium cohnii, Strain Seligo" /LENGTH=73 /DNA_ID=CAMNT_0054083575 /DNA_START=295 /DNA_END=512 /DNA_ORIENTATION=-
MTLLTKSGLPKGVANGGLEPDIKQFPGLAADNDCMPPKTGVGRCDRRCRVQCVHCAPSTEARRDPREGERDQA